MIKFAIFLLLINQYNVASAAPATSAKEIHLAEHLVKLAKQCPNKIISKQIMGKLEECDIVITTQNNPKQVKCLIFYEMNTRICNEKTITITDEMVLKLNVPVTVSDICKDASTWKFTEVNKNYNNLFENKTICSQICALDFMDDDSSFYCKYYNWGYKLLENSPKELHEEEHKVESVVPVANAPLDKTNIEEEKKAGDAISESNVAKEVSTKENDANVQNVEVVEKLPVSIPQTTQVVTAKTPSKVEGDITTEIKDGVKSNPSPIEKNDGQVSQNNTNVAVNVTESENKLPIQKNVPSALDKPNVPISDPDMYDSDDPEDEEKIPENEDKIADLMDEKNYIVPPKNGFIMETNDSDQPQAIVFSRTPFKDIYAPEQDTFVTYLLTALILLVVLYVLYHNKSKVTKVVLGLIVEGRQSGRRRNSRGHAYKRLDTLEQAISTNPSRAPTKIIY